MRRRMLIRVHVLLFTVAAWHTLAAAPNVAGTDCAFCPEIVPVPAGRFVMGAAPGEEEREGLAPSFRSRSEPQHEVTIRRFSAGRFEVTRGQYRTFVEATGRRSDGCFVWRGSDFEWDRTRDWRNPGFPQDDRHPVTCVSWEDASAYVEWLSQRTGGKYRLLTEAEWEYAARAGTTTSRFWGDEASCVYANGADRSTQAKAAGASDWHVDTCDDGHPYTAPVGSYKANAFGLHDMLGNVEEWTQDCWVATYSRAAAAGDCSMRAVRGGSWLDAGPRIAYRVGSPTTIRVYRRGFRVAMDP